MFIRINIILSLFILVCHFSLLSQSQTNETIYLIPGQGADYRLFQNINLPNYDTIIINYVVPSKNETLPEYAQRISTQIDTTKGFSLIGVSFGGMLCIEISKFLNPEKIIIISSAKGVQEFPWKYKFLNRIRLYKVFGGRFYKVGALIARPIFEPISRKNNQVFKDMIKDKPPKFMTRSIHCIVTWHNTEYPENLTHIHGTKDNTLPYKRIESPITIENGSHLMVFYKADEISEIILSILNN
jgi:pimeloyl-ACP methyl ester carboxylesterase